MKLKRTLPVLFTAVALLALSMSVTMAAGPLGTAFTYQGRLTDGGNPANGSYDLQFKLFDAASAGGQIGSTQTKDNVNVASGLFSVTLDFGASAFNGQARYLEIAVRAGSSTGAYTTLTPRQQLNPSPYALFSSAPWVTIGNNIYFSQGNVGIGTNTPSALLSVVKSGAPEPTVLGVPTGFKVGTPEGTIPLALKHDTAEEGTPALAFFETSDGPLGSLGANAGAFVVGAAANKALAFNVNNTTRAMTIASNGAIGVNATNIYAQLEVRGSGNTSSTFALRVTDKNGNPLFQVRDDGLVYVKFIPWQFSTFGVHVCQDDSGYLMRCSYATSYVPSIDGGHGFPETAELVSMAQTVSNPYGDARSPFAVEKTATPCDPNLLGYISDPGGGADGVKLNEHYLPLAISGNFPAKVTTENGIIQRGDPLTSSSKSGYAMKATGACRIIGYALEDANIEGTIQVFANTGESSAPVVASLREQVKSQDAEIAELKQQVAGMRQQNVALEERIAALEQFGTANNTGTALNLNWLLVGGIALCGLVLVRQARKEK